jgi:beta-galactosidase
VADCTFVGPGDDDVSADWEGESLEAPVFNDILEPLDGAETLALYGSNYYEGMPALVRNRFGKGECYCFGGAFGEKTARVFLERLGIAEPFSDVISLPACCELAIREKDGKRYAFALNYSDRDAAVTLHKKMYDMFAGAQAVGKVILKKYEARVYRVEG